MSKWTFRFPNLKLVFWRLAYFALKPSWKDAPRRELSYALYDASKHGTGDDFEKFYSLTTFSSAFGPLDRLKRCASSRASICATRCFKAHYWWRIWSDLLKRIFPLATSRWSRRLPESAAPFIFAFLGNTGWRTLGDQWLHVFFPEAVKPGCTGNTQL